MRLNPRLVVQLMKQFATIIIKPTLDCNLHCKHCYHLLSERSKDVLDINTFERVVRLVREGFEDSRYIWHGGEPLMVPMSFYKKAFAIQRKYYGISCDNTIQTSGSLLNQRFIEFCKTNRVNIGVSYEGGFESGLRPDMNVNNVDSMIEYMVKKRHMFLVSATIHGGNVDKMSSIYKKFRDIEASLSLNPIINMGTAVENPDLILDPDIYIKNSIELFDTWIKDSDVKIPVLPFYPYVMTVIDGRPNVSDCPHASCLGKWLCVYPNGDVYPCGKACPKDFCLGNINEVNSIDDLFKSKEFRNILINSINRRKRCKSCCIYDYCNGGCSVDAFVEGDMTRSEFVSCKIYRGLMPHIRDVITDILENKPDMNTFNGFIRDAILGKLINPQSERLLV